MQLDPEENVPTLQLNYLSGSVPGIAHHLKKLHGTEQNNQTRPLISPASCDYKHRGEVYTN